MKTKIKIILIFVLGVVLLVFFSIYFQKGIIIEDNFFRVMKENSSTTYYGEIDGLDITIRQNNTLFQTNQIEYITKLSKREFAVDYKETVSGRYNVRIYENDKVLFSGQYDSNINDAFKLFDDMGNIYFSKSQGFIQNEDRVITNSEYAIYKIVISIALKDYEIDFRGQFYPFILAIILIALFILDIVSPKMLNRFTSKFVNENYEPNQLSSSRIVRMIITLIIAISLLLLSVF